MPDVERGDATGGWCLICGSRGSADAILNVVLFAPLGALLARRWVPDPRPAAGPDASRVPAIVALLGAGAVALLLSLGVEAIQILLPGRDANPGDVLFNTLGGAAGAAVWLKRDAWLRPGERQAAVLCAGAGIGVAAVLGVTALALSPAPTRSVYWGQWTPDLGHLETYRGRALRATVGGLAVPVGRSPRSDTLRGLLRAGAEVRTVFVAGPPPSGVAPIFSIYDREQREVVLLGASGDDLVFRIRRRAADLRLDVADSRLPGALARLAPGDTAQATSFVEGGRRCLGTDPGPGACGVGPTLSDGWSLLYHAEPLSGKLRSALGALWCAALMLPVGLWLRRRSLCAFGAALPLAALWLLPAVTAPEPTPAAAYAAGLAGLVGGALLAARARGPAPA